MSELDRSHWASLTLNPLDLARLLSCVAAHESLNGVGERLFAHAAGAADKRKPSSVRPLEPSTGPRRDLEPAAAEQEPVGLRQSSYCAWPGPPLRRFAISARAFVPRFTAASIPRSPAEPFGGIAPSWRARLLVS